MKLFNDKGEMPSGVRMMLEQMLRSAAPAMASDVDVITRFVRTLDARLTRIENALRIANHGQSEQLTIDTADAGPRAIEHGHEAGDGGNSATCP